MKGYPDTSLSSPLHGLVAHDRRLDPDDYIDDGVSVCDIRLYVGRLECRITEKIHHHSELGSDISLTS